MSTPTFNLKYLAALVATALSLASCTSEELITDGAAPDSEKLTLQIAVPADAGPATRGLDTADEFDVKEVSVLAFDADDRQFLGRYHGFVTEGPTQTTGAGATMTFQVTLPYGEYELMVVANADAMLAAAASTLVKGAAQSAVAETLRMTMGASGWEDDNTDPDHFIPMWGLKKGVNISDGFTLTDPIRLTRMVAKVDVRMTDELIAAGNFELKSVRVYNYIEQGRLIPDLAAGFDWDGVSATTLAGLARPSLPTSPRYTVADSQTEFTDYTIPEGETELLRSIYLFESPAGKPAEQPGNHLLNTCVVIGGDYDNSGTTSWYRIDFATVSGSVWTYLPLIRNHSYGVLLNRVGEPGYPTPDDALRGTPRLEAEVLDWTGVGEDAIFDGEYFLDVDADSVDLLGSGWPETFGAETNYSITDQGFPAGLQLKAAEIDYLSGGSDWLTVTGGADGELAREFTFEGTINQTGAPRQADIYLRAGNMTKVIRLTQRKAGMLAAPGVLGYSEVSRQITLRGAREFRGTPVEAAAEEMFPGQGLHKETVYVAYYKWGSLIGTDSETTDYSPETIVDAPVGYKGATTTATALAAAREDFGDFDEIPYGDPDGEGTRDEYPLPFPATDVNLGIGDPCLKMTEGGGGWRIPTGDPFFKEGTAPFGNIADNAGTGTTGNAPWEWNPGARWVQQGTDGFPVSGGVGAKAEQTDWSFFLPAAGRRIGIAGSSTYTDGELTFVFNNGTYWTSSFYMSGNSEVSPGVLQIYQRGPNSNGFGANQAFAIRCVQGEIVYRHLLAAPGVIGYTKDTHELTLRGSKEFASNPDIAAAAEEMFPGEGLHEKTVYAAYFKFGSLVATGGENAAHFTDRDLIAAPVEYTYSGQTGMEAVRTRVVEAIEDNMASSNPVRYYAWTAVPWRAGTSSTTVKNDAWTKSLSRGQGDPCAYYFGDGWKIPSGSPAWDSENDSPFGTTATTAGAWTLPGGGRWIDNWDSSANPFGRGVVGGKGDGAPDWSRFLTAAGYRPGTLSIIGGTIYNMGREVAYWSSSTYNENYGLAISATADGVNPTSQKYYYTYGLPIRCVKELPGVTGPGVTPPHVSGFEAPEYILAVNHKGQLNLDGQKYIEPYTTNPPDEFNRIVYFRYGSLIATGGSSLTQDWTSSAVVWIPEEYKAPASWVWEDIPYNGEVTVAPDPATGKGDPCRLAVKDGVVGGYRMPTWKSLAEWDGGMSASSEGERKVVREGINAYIVVYNKSRSFFYPPLIGYRSNLTNTPIIDPPKSGFWSPGISGYYWAADGYNFHPVVTGDMVTVTATVDTSRSRGDAFAIRCVPVD